MKDGVGNVRNIVDGKKTKKQFGDLAVILERYHGCLSMGSCSGEGEK